MSSCALTVDALAGMTPDVNGQDVVRLASRHLFLGEVKAQAAVRDVFFPGCLHGGGGGGSGRGEVDLAVAATWFDSGEYAVLFTCQAICKLGDEFGIHSLLDELIVDEKLGAVHASSEWKKVGKAGDIGDDHVP